MVDLQTAKTPRNTARSSLKALLSAARGRHRTEAGAVTDALREAIVRGTLSSGLPLRQDSLAAEFGVSRMPVREGIRRLEAEGLVDFKPHCGAVVAALRAEDVREIADMRVALESMALGKALAAPNTARLKEAERWLLELDEAEALDFRNQINRRFHYALYALSPSNRAYRHFEMLYDAYERYLIVEHRRLEDRRARSQSEHRQIFAACVAGDAARAQLALRAHIEGAADELISYLERFPEPPDV